MADVQTPSPEKGKKRKTFFLCACKAVGHFLTNLERYFFKNLGLKRTSKRGICG